MPRAWRCLLFLALIIALAPAAAQQPGRWYLGAGGAYAHSQDYCGPFFDTVVLACDNTSLGYKVFGGAHLLDFLAVELGYASLGKFTSDLSILGVPVSDATRIRGPLLEAVVHLPVAGGFSLIGKAGGIYWTIEQDFFEAGAQSSQSKSGVDMVLGLGAQYQVHRYFAVRAEYEYFPNLGKPSETGDMDLNFYSLSLLLRF